MVEWTAETIAQRAFDLNLLDERELRDIWGELGSRSVDPDEIKQILQRRGLLTNYQIERLLRGDRTGFYFGEYKVQYLVGTGSFARVYRAVHRKTGQVVALKVLRTRFSEDPEQREQFCREGEMGRTLRHANIVPIYEVSSRGMTHYLVMEFIEGRTLREFIKARKKFDPIEATKLMTDMAAGLDYAAQRGITHRDLKSSNVLISSSRVAKLVDFGLAAATSGSDDSLEDCTNPRTIDYAGLERATGVRKDDIRSDIYFLGSIFYHMLSGVPALTETRDRIQRLSKHRFVDVKPLDQVAPEVPRQLVAIIRKSMELDPTLRYQTPGEMLMDLKVVGPMLKSGTAGGPDSNGTSPAQRQKSLMIVESNAKMQDLLREKLKKAGYRVLVTNDPQRAVSLFMSENAAPPADCVVFSTGDLGEESLEAFNQFGDIANTRNVPAVLLLGEGHDQWKSQAKLDSHRRLVTTPIKLREFRELLASLMDESQVDAAR